MSKLIIVCGLPGSGKTTLAEKLSEKSKIVCLHKDSIKESLYDVLGLETLEDSRDIGKKSIELLYKLAEEQLSRGLDLMIEAPFRFEEDYAIFENWKEKFDLDLYSVICFVDNKERKNRFESRPRHNAHHHDERNPDWENEYFDYENIPGKQIRIKTDRGIDENIDYVLSEIF